MNQFECARILVGSGCKVSAFDLLGRLPIIEAARLRQAATLNLLLKANGPSYSQEFLGKNLKEEFLKPSMNNNYILSFRNGTHYNRYFNMILKSILYATEFELLTS
jgi:hypothetical protein